MQYDYWFFHIYIIVLWANIVETVFNCQQLSINNIFNALFMNYIYFQIICMIIIYTYISLSILIDIYI